MVDFDNIIDILNNYKKLFQNEHLCLLNKQDVLSDRYKCEKIKKEFLKLSRPHTQGIELIGDINQESFSFIISVINLEIEQCMLSYEKKKIKWYRDHSLYLTDVVRKIKT